MKVIFYGSVKPSWPVYLEKPLKNYSNGSAMQFITLTPKQFAKEAKKMEKWLKKNDNI